MSRHLQALYGVKWNPFLPGVPTEALYATPRVHSLRERLRQRAEVGGFALLTGEPGTGKSAALRIIKHSLEEMPDVVVGVITRPQSTISEFYRELGDLFGIRLSTNNRWGGSKALRDRWVDHCDRTKFRPVLIIDEAQESRTEVLSELRLLTSYMLDSQLLLLVVLAGDQRMVERLATPDLLPLASRIRTRAALIPQSAEDLRALLEHLLVEAGASRILSDEAKVLLASHANGNVRVMMNMGAELLEVLAEQNAEVIDERLFFEHFTNLTRERDKEVVRRRAR